MGKVTSININATVTSQPLSIENPYAVISRIVWEMNTDNVKVSLMYWDSEDDANNGTPPLNAKEYGLPESVDVDATDDFFAAVSAQLGFSIANEAKAEIDPAAIETEIITKSLEEEPK